MSLLLASLIALVAGPLLVRGAGAYRPTMTALDGFVLVGVGGLVLVSLIPHTIAEAGWIAIPVAAVGLLAPGFIERSLHRAARQTHTATLLLAFAGVALHALVDGVALGTSGGSGEHVLAISVVLHRLPEAITIWWLLRPRGAALASAVLAAVGCATVLGYHFGAPLASAVEGTGLGLFQALVAGMLLHVIFHRVHPLADIPHTGQWRVHGGLGALAGIALVAALAGIQDLHHDAGTLDVGSAFLALALASAPALLVAFAATGVAQAFLPRARPGGLRTGSAATEALRGAVFGLPLPICSCEVIPTYRSLAAGAAPATAAMAFLLATPGLGFDGILLSIPLLGLPLGAARLGAALLVAVLVGATVGRLARGPARAEPDAAAPASPHWLVRLRAGLHFGFVDVVGHTGPWLLLGLSVAALAESMVAPTLQARIPAGLDVPLFALLGLPFYVCASGATPLVAVLLYKGVSPGAALAFLLTGPATSMTTFGVLAGLHGRRVALALGGAVALLTVACGYLVNALLGRSAGLSLAVVVQEPPSVVAVASLFCLTGVFLLSLLRQGPRGFVSQILWPQRASEPGAEGHDHDHDHDHDDHDHHHHHHSHQRADDEPGAPADASTAPAVAGEAR